MLSAGGTRADKTSARRRWVLFLIAMIPLAALLGLMLWGLVRSGGNPGGLLVNENPGEIAIETGAAPALELATLDGGPVISNASLRGKVAFVDFWSSWCPPCRAEAKGIAEVYLEYEGEGVEFLGVAIWDGTRDVLAHIERYGVTYPNGLDDRGELAVSFGVRGVPEKYFLAPDGTIIRKFTGPISREHLREILDELLAAYDL
jgi:cytochrome c biogenesis protein CcmG/thiol:disulfide interchange protein DsbE